MRLPYGGVWSGMVLAPSDRLSINLDDLRDYYYLLRWPGPLERSSALGPALRPRNNLGRVTQRRYGQVYQSLQVLDGTNGYPNLYTVCLVLGSYSQLPS